MKVKFDNHTDERGRDAIIIAFDSDMEKLIFWSCVSQICASEILTDEEQIEFEKLRDKLFQLTKDL